jgi:DNA-binding transcriptional regulator PaaX
MAISLTEDEIGQQLKAAGEHGSTRRALNFDAALARVIKEGYVVARVDLMLFYRLTDRGQQALADAITEGG